MLGIAVTGLRWPSVLVFFFFSSFFPPCFDWLYLVFEEADSMESCL